MPDKLVEGKVSNGETISPPKRKRGRPRKNPENKGLVNEGENRIEMSNNSNKPNNSNKSSKVMSKEEYEQISIEAVQRKWNNVFGKFNTYVNQGGDINDIMYNPALANRNNPFVNNQRVKSIISQGQKIDKKNVIEYCEDPQNNEFNLQNTSWGMYYQSQIYQSLLRIDREIPRFYTYAFPDGVSLEEMKKDSFKKEKKKVDSIIRVLKPVVTFKDMITQISNEGKILMLPRISYDDKEAFFFTWQKIPNQYWKIVGFGSDDRFVTMFDMSLFLSGIYDPAQYPEFIQEKWEELLTTKVVNKRDKGNGYVINPKSEIPLGDILEYNGDSWFYWYRIPQNMAFVFSQDGGSPNVLPDSTSLLPDIVDLNDYKQLQQSLLAKGATAILTAEALIKPDSPPGKDSTYCSTETLLGISDYVNQMVGDTIVPVFFPLHDYKLHSIQDDVSPAIAVVTSRQKDVINTSNMGALLSTTDKPSIITVKTARDLAEAKARYICSQFENAVNKIVNTSFGLKYQWKIKFHGYAFSDLEEKKLLKELVLSGMKGLLPVFLSCYNLTLDDYAVMHNMSEAEDIKIIKDELIYQIEATEKMQSESLQVSEDMQDKSLEAGLEQSKINAKTKSVKVKDTGINETTKRGRPTKSDTEISDNTNASREGGGNDSEVKEFIMQHFAGDFTEEELEEMIAEEMMGELENTNVNKPKVEKKK